MPRLRWPPTFDRRDDERDARLGSGAELRVLRVRRPKYGCRAWRARSIRRRLPSARLPRAWPRRGSSPRCWSASTATTRRSIARPRSSPATASGSNDRPWRAGSAAPAGGWSRCRRGLPPMSLPRPSRSPTTHPFRCSIPAVEEPRPDGSPVYARDDRPWAGPEPPAAVYFYSPDRKAVRPASHLEGFRGVLQVDG